MSIVLTFRRAALVAIGRAARRSRRGARRDGRADRPDGHDADQGEAGPDVDGTRRDGRRDRRLQRLPRRHEGQRDASITATTYTDNAATRQHQPSYTVKAVETGTNLESAASAAFAVVYDTTVPTTPTGVSATTPTNAAPVLTWTASTDALSGVRRYQVLRGTTVLGTTSALTYTDTTVPAAGSYSYSVKAEDWAGNLSTAGAKTVVFDNLAADHARRLQPGRLAADEADDVVDGRHRYGRRRHRPLRGVAGRQPERAGRQPDRRRASPTPPSRSRRRTSTSSSPSTRPATAARRPPSRASPTTSRRRPCRPGWSRRHRRPARSRRSRSRPRPTPAAPASRATACTATARRSRRPRGTTVSDTRADGRRLLRLPRVGPRRGRQRVGAVERRGRRLRQDRAARRDRADAAATPTNAKPALTWTSGGADGLSGFARYDVYRGAVLAGTLGDGRVHRHRALHLGLLQLHREDGRQRRQHVERVDGEDRRLRRHRAARPGLRSPRRRRRR